MQSMNDMTTQQRRERVAVLQNERAGHVSRRDWDAAARVDTELDPLRAILRMNDNPAAFTLHRW